MIDRVAFMEEFENYSAGELEEIKRLVEETLEGRSAQRFNNLMNQILTAVHCIEKEFPCAEIRIDYDGEEINLLDYTWDDGMFYQ